MGVTVKLEGGRELDRALGELPKATARNTLVRALKKGAIHVQEVWQPMVPVLSGHYQHSIIVGPNSKLTRSQKRDAKKEGKHFAEYHVGSNDPAAQQLEFGNSHMPPNPTGQPAWEATKDNVLAEFGKDFWTEIEKSAARLARKQAKAGL